MNSTTVLIVGSGPTGLTLACELARRDIPVRIIERFPEYPRGSRAKGLQPRSLEVFDDLGIATKTLAAGNTEVVFRRFNGPHLLGDVKRQIFPREDTRFLSGAMIPQWKVEEILREKLSAYNVHVDLSTELIGFSQTDDVVIAQLKTQAGSKDLVFRKIRDQYTLPDDAPVRHYYRLLRVAAISIVVLGAGLYLLLRQHPQEKRSTEAAFIDADGVAVALDDMHRGMLAGWAGITFETGKDGEMVYVASSDWRAKKNETFKL